MVSKKIFNIFKQGSRTYFYSSLFFPTGVRGDVFRLYSFVRKADDYVDCKPPQKDKFFKFKEKYYQALSGKKVNDEVIDGFIELMQKRGFEREWIDKFFISMEMDLFGFEYKKLEDAIEYMHGSAEVIGLMMSKIMGLPKKSFENAKMLGRSMQYINFIRDIDEDNGLGRTYFPREDLEKFKLKNLKKSTISKNKKSFQEFVDFQLKRYKKWQKEAEGGYQYIPKRYLIPIKTASDLYNWTAKNIEKDPHRVFKEKIKPGMPYIMMKISNNTMNIIR